MYTMVIFRYQWFVAVALAVFAAASPVCAQEEKAPAVASPPDGGAAQSAAFVGVWHRTDGGYRLEIREGKTPGSVTVQYFNPDPIKVKLAGFREMPGDADLFHGIDLSLPVWHKKDRRGPGP